MPAIASRGAQAAAPRLAVAGRRWAFGAAALPLLAGAAIFLALPPAEDAPAVIDLTDLAARSAPTAPAVPAGPENVEVMVQRNDTLDRMLSHCRKARQFVMIGPTAGCLPDALFDRGVTALGGSWVVDGRQFVDALRAGESRGAAARKFALTPAGYPGFTGLMQRL